MQLLAGGNGGYSGNGAYISIASHGSYTEPTSMTISAGVQVNTIRGGDVGSYLPGSPLPIAFRGAGVGFYAGAVGFNQPDFIGAVINVNGDGTVGSVTFSDTPNIPGQPPTQNNLVSAIAWPTAKLGAFSTSIPYVVSYSINTVATSGGISNFSIMNPNNGVTERAAFLAIDDYSGPNPYLAANIHSANSNTSPTP